MSKQKKTPQGKASEVKGFGNKHMDSVTQDAPVLSADELAQLPPVDTVCAGERIYTLDEEANTLTVQYPQRAPKLLGTWLKVTHSILDENGENPHIRVVLKDGKGLKHGPLIFGGTEVVGGGNDVINRLVKANYRLETVQTRGGYSDVLNYLNAAEGEPATGVTEAGWTRDGRAFVLPNDGAVEVLNSAKGERIEYIGSYDGFPKFCRQGTPEGWVKDMEPILKQSRLLSACAAWSLAPILLKFAPIVEGGALYLWGGSGLGKTTAGKVALSLWGAVEKETDRASFRSSKNNTGLEAYLASHDGLIAVYDELAENDSPQDVERLAYLLGNGSIKMRATVTGALRKRKEIKTFSLGSGERSLEGFKGARLDEGARQRMGEIHISDRKDVEGFTPGVFEALPADSWYRTEAKRQYEAALETWRAKGSIEKDKPKKVSPYGVLSAPLSTLSGFGHAGPAYVKALIKSLGEDETTPEKLQDEIGEYISEWCANHQTKAGQSGMRFARRCALMAYAGEDALKKGVFKRADGSNAFEEGWFSRAAAHVYSIWADGFRDADSNEQELISDFMDMLASRRTQFIEFVEDENGKFKRVSGQGEITDAFGAIVLKEEPQCGPNGRTCPPVERYYLLAGSSGLRLATKNVVHMDVIEMASILDKHDRLRANYKKKFREKFTGGRRPFEGIDSLCFVCVLSDALPKE